MNTAQKGTLMQFFKAVGQPERLRMLGLMANKGYSVPELAKAMGLKETAVSSGIRLLSRAELIKKRMVSNTVVYQLNSAKLAEMKDIIDGTVTPETLEAQVMKQYIQGETLTTIPQEEEEREIILAWLVQKFDLEKRYTEEEVTDIVANHYRYPLTLRRILADNHFLMQTGRHYWRPLPNRNAQRK